ncbi:unnamed protein product, partial [Protopolystoma xenopodis]
MPSSLRRCARLEQGCLGQMGSMQLKLDRVDFCGPKLRKWSFGQTKPIMRSHFRPHVHLCSPDGPKLSACGLPV